MKYEQVHIIQKNHDCNLKKQSQYNNSKDLHNKKSNILQKYGSQV